MSVNNGQDVDAAVTNAAFMSRVVDTDTTGKVDLKNASSANVLDAQQVINDNITNIATNASDILTNAGNISTNADNIGTNVTNIGINTGDIATINLTLLDKADLVGGKIPVSQMPTSAMLYLGNWDASTNTPTLINGTGTNGDIYLVSVAGSHDFGAGAITFAVGDWVIYNGAVWEKSLNSATVTSVNGKIGVVVLNADDIAETATKFWDVKNIRSSATDPTVNDDSGSNFVIGSTYFNSTSGVLWLCQDNTLGAAVWIVASGSGSGVGSSSIFGLLNGDNDDITNWTETGIGTFSFNEATPIHGLVDYKFITGALSDKIERTISIDPRSQNKYISCKFQYKVDQVGMVASLYDGATFLERLDLEIAASITSAVIETQLTNVSNLTIRFESESFPAAQTLYVDDVEFNDDPFSYKNLSNDTELINYTPTFQGFGTVANIDIKYAQTRDLMYIQGKFTVGTSTADEAQMSLFDNLPIDISKMAVKHVVGDFWVDANSTDSGGTILGTGDDTFVNFSRSDARTAAADSTLIANGNGIAGSGTTIYVELSVPILNWKPEASHVVHSDANGGVDAQIESKTWVAFKGGTRVINFTGTTIKGSAASHVIDASGDYYLIEEDGLYTSVLSSGSVVDAVVMGIGLDLASLSADPATWTVDENIASKRNDIGGSLVYTISGTKYLYKDQKVYPVLGGINSGVPKSTFAISKQSDSKFVAIRTEQSGVQSISISGAQNTILLDRAVTGLLFDNTLFKASGDNALSISTISGRTSFTASKEIIATVGMSLYHAAGVAVSAYINGVLFSTGRYPASNNYGVDTTFSIPLKENEVLDFRINTSVLSSSTAPANFNITTSLPNQTGIVPGKFAPIRTVYLKDIKPSGTGGGNTVTGSYLTRDLNTISGDSEVVKSLTANQFILRAGKYKIDTGSPIYTGGLSKSRLYNITDSVVAIQGASVFGYNTTGGDSIVSVCKGIIEIFKDTTFELQYRVQFARATTGLGNASSFGDDETYSQAEIEQLIRY